LFKKDANCFVFDYYIPFLEGAKKMGLKTAEGGINELYMIDEKPDLVILSHVLEHLPNIERELDTIN
jgi:hypothetical protein